MPSVPDRRADLLNPYLPHEAEVVEKVVESDTIFTLRLRFTDPEIYKTYRFAPGQFNMVYLYGVGEVPISIVSDPEDDRLLDHTIRAVGRVTQGLARLDKGDRVGVRGPYGRGWPLQEARGKDVIVVTGGLGCAPVVSVINYVVRRRSEYGRLNIVQGVKHSKDLIYRERYDTWAKLPDTHVFLAASTAEGFWPGHIGLVTDLFDHLDAVPASAVSMMCGPEGMMIAAAKRLGELGLPESGIYMSMERNMQCALGHCGHCQYGGHFICRNGPVFAFPEVKQLLGVRGF